MRAIILALAVAGCMPPMANDKIIAEVNKCHSAGMRAAEMMQGGSGPVVGVQCLLTCPKDSLCS